MNCKKCGSPLTENDQFCKSCGAAANETSASNMNTVGNNMNYSTPTNNMSSPVGQPMNSSINNGMNNSTNNQPAWANSYNSQPTYNQMPQKNNGNTKFIIIGIVIAVAIFAGIIIVGMFSGDNETSTGGSSSNGGSSSQVSKSTYNVKFKGFTFSIPDNLIYEEDNGVLMIGDELGTWAAQIELEQGSFAQLQANKSQLQSVMQQSGFTSSIAQEKTIGGVNFITLEISASGTNAIAALAKANSMYFIGVTAYNQDNDFDYSLLEKIAPVVSSASYTGETTNMESNTKLDMSGIAGLAK